MHFTKQLLCKNGDTSRPDLELLERTGGYPVKSKGTYADEIMRMCDVVGPDHVACGTDMEGVWPNRMMNDCAPPRDSGGAGPIQ